jgi:hypothetical protein
MLYWYANIPEETIFYQYRNQGQWYYYTLFLITCHFIIPFLLLLTQPNKLIAKRLCAIAVWVITMHFADMYWIIMPARQVNVHPGRFASTTGFIDPKITDLTSLVGLLCLLGFFFLRGISKNNLFPNRDPRLEDCLKTLN